MRTTTGTRISRGTQAKRLVGFGTALTFGLASLTAFAPDARAEEVSPRGKGIVGGALLGGEVVTITGSLVGISTPWYYVIGGAAGAVGGGVVGHFVENGSTDGRVPTYMLAGGIALIIPAVVLTLNATRYQPKDLGSEDQAPIGPAPEPGTAGGSIVIGGGQTATPPSPPPETTPAPAATPAPSPGSSGPPQTLLDYRKEGGLRVGVPIPEVRAMYSMQQLKELGVPQQTEYRLPVVKVTF